MPTYAYTCTECDHAFDIRQAFSDDALTTCPQCQGRLRKVFSSVGVTFKGSGFYRTDSRSKTTSTSGSTTSKSGGSTTSGGSSSDSSGSSSSSGAGASTSGAPTSSSSGSSSSGSSSSGSA